MFSALNAYLRLVESTLVSLPNHNAWKLLKLLKQLGLALVFFPGNRFDGELPVVAIGAAAGVSQIFPNDLKK